MKNKTWLSWLLILLSAAMLLAGCTPRENQPDTPQLPGTTFPEQTEDRVDEITEESGIPFVTQYIILSYPAQLEDMVTVEYEQLADGQQILFFTEFTGEKLELFRFSISKSGTEGFTLGVLNDEKDGALQVCVAVKDYSDGNWAPEDYTKLLSMQDHVNDIIVQFHQDPRFTAAKS